MKNVLFVTPIDEEHQKRFQQYPITFIPREQVKLEDVEQVTAILGNLPVEYIQHASHLEWLQTDSAGINQYQNISKNITVTNASGAYGVAISEHMIGCILGVTKNLFAYAKQQESRSWTNLGSVDLIQGANVLSVGMGDIGSNFAKKMNLLGAKVSGVRRTIHDQPEYIEHLYTQDNLPNILGQFDIVALSLPQTNQTVHLFDEALLRKMKKGAILLNVGRGNAIDMDALSKLMQEKYFKAVCLDVTDPEPLPKNHPLWTMENVYITPHISGRFNASYTFDRVLDIYEENLKRYFADHPLINVTDITRGY